MISSLLNLQASNCDDERLREALRESQNRVKAMGLTHQLLYEHKDFSRVDLGEYLARLAQLLWSAHRARGKNTRMELVLPVATHYVGIDKAIPCGLAVNELITNSFKHAFPDARAGVISLALTKSDADEIVLSVGDDGVGLPPNFDVGTAKSLGLRLVPLLTEQLQALLAVESGQGTRYTLRFRTGITKGTPS
jgi:two-component sensor histidine kinase